MKLIIDIPEKVVTAIQNGEDYRFDIHTAIAQGVPYGERPQDDLISRSYLKQMIPTPIEDEYKYVHQIINNAPAVADRTEEVLSLQSTIAKLVGGIAENARPEGEWIRSGINAEGMDIYRCSICNRLIVTWSARINEYPYCHCGAKMGV